MRLKHHYFDSNKRFDQYVHRRAFTLLELIAALALIVVLASISVPTFYRGFMSHRTLDQSVDSVIETILMSKRLAIEKSTPYVYEFRSGTNLQTVYPINNSIQKQTKPLSKSVRLEGDATSSQGTVQLLFREDGSTDGLTITVAYGVLQQDLQVQRHLGVPQRTHTRLRSGSR